VSEWDLIQELQDSLAENTLQSISVINIGGGFPARYKNISDVVIDSVFSKIDELQEWCKARELRLLVEPGRYLAAPCIELHTHVQSVIDDAVVVDASVYNSSMDTILVPIKLLIKGESDSGRKYVVKGSTPCSMDIFRYDARLAQKPAVGDQITFLNAGAYNFATEFCELDKIKTKIVD
jgi:ornithine decarboxylase